MDTNERKPEENEELEKPAEELESEAEERDEGRLEAERDEQEDLNQGMQTGTHDASYRGIKWGPADKIKKRSASASQGSGDSKTDADK
jgi:flagellar biosynthesis/type III secretory pathway protein FliH